MQITEHIASLSEEGRLLAAAAEQAGPGASVPTCPGWQIRHLLRHTGMVHRWAAAFVTEGHTAYQPDGGEPALDGAELLAWFREGHRRLVRSLEEAPADLDCWTFLPAPSPLAFWSRRQLNETTVHRVDAESALGSPLTPVSADRAVDGIDELLTGLHARPTSKVRSEKPRTLRVRAVDTAATWTVRISQDPPQAVRSGAEAESDDGFDCELSGTAEGLYLVLWNRLPLTALTLRGDRAVARLWTDNSAVTW
ncbi:maleylpyruvate isomerase family mycothiol-dependent enzyme [Streptomyces sp. NPDC055886]